MKILIVTFILICLANLGHAESIENNTTLAQMHKKMGDDFFTKNELSMAAEEYIKALNYSKQFTEEELLTIAKRISWGGRMHEAENVLIYLLQMNPKNNDAKLHLARVISWQGRQLEAIEITETFLKTDPNNLDAFLIKANALRFMGKTDHAVELYEKILSQREDFDTRIGMIYSYVTLEISSEIEKIEKLLKPIYPYQEKDIRELQSFKKSVLNPNIITGYTFYHDTDKNKVHTLKLGFQSFIDDYKIKATYLFKKATDETKSIEANEITFGVSKRIGISTKLYANAGVSQSKNSSTFIGNIGGNYLIGNGEIDLSLSRTVMADTAELLENTIKMNSFNFSVQQIITDRLSFSANYNYRWYSDSNKSQFIQIIPKYKIFFVNPTLSIGYRGIYLNFNEHKRNGYFDPKDYFSHQILFTIYHEFSNTTFYFEPYIGYQSYKRYGIKHNDLIGGAVGTLGIKISNNLNIEISAEGGNYAVNTAAGWKYYQIGFMLKYVF